MTSFNTSEPPARAQIMQYINYHESDFQSDPYVFQWIESANPEISLVFSGKITGTFQEVLNLVKHNSFDDILMSRCYSPGHYIIVNDHNLFNISIATNDPFLKKYRSCVVTMYGLPAIIENTYKVLTKESRIKSMVNWYYKSSNRIEKAEFEISTDHMIKPEFYPWIPDIDEYLNIFEESSSGVLILIGPPGTGKTSFIRNLIQRSGKNCMTTYDIDIMSSDDIYVDFIGDSDTDYLILEDSDLLLTSRMRDNNHVMNLILNASDGLVPIHNKKFIFTANVRDSSNFDDALIRSGRCFDIMKFRSLSYDEAMSAANSIGINFIGNSEKTYTLSEIFNGVQKVYSKNKFSFEER